MRFIVDACLSPEWVEVLRSAGYEAGHWDRIGQVGASDEEILANAASSGAIILTLDRDFGELLRETGGRFPSVVQVGMRDALPETLGARLLEFLAVHRMELEAGAFASIGKFGSRIIPLPMGGEISKEKVRDP